MAELAAQFFNPRWGDKKHIEEKFQQFECLPRLFLRRGRPIIMYGIIAEIPQSMCPIGKVFSNFKIVQHSINKRMKFHIFGRRPKFIFTCPFDNASATYHRVSRLAHHPGKLIKFGIDIRRQIIRLRTLYSTFRELAFNLVIPIKHLPDFVARNHISRRMLNMVARPIHDIYQRA